MEGSYPGEVLVAGWKRIPGHLKAAFFSAVICGLLAHLYIMANLLPNHDGFTLLDTLPLAIRSGRWFEPVLVPLSRGLLLPWLRGLLSILYIAGSAALVADCFQVRDRAGCILVGALMAVFPAVTSIYTYMVYVDVMMAALPLASLGMWLTWKYRYGILPGVLLMACCLGTYQAFFAVSAAMAVGALLLALLGGDSPKRVLLCGLKYLAALALAFLVNLLVVKLTTRGATLTAYQGIDRMGQVDVLRLPWHIKAAYTSIWNFFYQDVFQLLSPWFSAAFLALLLLAGVWLVLVVARGKLYRDLPRLLFLLLLGFLYPVACNVIYLTDTTNMDIYPSMLYGLVMLPVLLLALLERTAGALRPQGAAPGRLARPLGLFRKAAALAVSLLLCGYAFGYIRAANITYLKMQVAHDQAQAYSVELITRIRGHEDYDSGAAIAFAGKPGGDIYMQEALAGWTGFVGATPNIPASYSYRIYLTYCLGIPVGVADPYPDIQASLEADPVFQAMPLYPDAGSIARFGDTMVVKFEE